MILGLLVVVAAVDTVAVFILLALTLRGRSAPSSSMTMPAALAATTAPQDDPERDALKPIAPVAADGPVVAEPDPLADAITAFLGRSEGLFRAGGAPGEPRPAEANVGTGPPHATSDRGSGVPNAPAILDRSLPDVTWSPARPARYVASGSRPGPSPEHSEPETAVPGPEIGSTPVAGSPAAAAPPRPDQPPRRLASRLRVALVARDQSDPEAAGPTVARLSPVIGGLLRERTRGQDRIEPEGQGRYAVVLPDTPLDGAEALGRRLAANCDAWLAAELPPLRLELRPAEEPGGVPPTPPEPGREPAAERRRRVAYGA
jgi:hypothetical protein